MGPLHFVLVWNVFFTQNICFNLGICWSQVYVIVWLVHSSHMANRMFISFESENKVNYAVSVSTVTIQSRRAVLETNVMLKDARSTHASVFTRFTDHNPYLHKVSTPTLGRIFRNIRHNSQANHKTSLCELAIFFLHGYPEPMAKIRPCTTFQYLWYGTFPIKETLASDTILSRLNCI